MKDAAGGGESGVWGLMVPLFSALFFAFLFFMMDASRFDTETGLWADGYEKAQVKDADRLRSALEKMKAAGAEPAQCASGKDAAGKSFYLAGGRYYPLPANCPKLTNGEPALWSMAVDDLESIGVKAAKREGWMGAPGQVSQSKISVASEASRPEALAALENVAAQIEADAAGRNALKKEREEEKESKSNSARESLEGRRSLKFPTIDF